MMIISYPEPHFRTKNENGNEIIFDPLRKKWIVLTPEEWVRQNFLQYLLQVKNYPASLIAIEKEIKLGDLKKRFDILVYNNNHQPWMMIECKGSTRKLDEKVLEQVLLYNISVPVVYIIITNGNLTFGWQRQADGLIALTEIPSKI